MEVVQSFVMQFYKLSKFHLRIIVLAAPPICILSAFICFFPFDVSDRRCGIIVSIPDHCLPFYLVLYLIPLRSQMNLYLSPFEITERIRESVIIFKLPVII